MIRLEFDKIPVVKKNNRPILRKGKRPFLGKSQRLVSAEKEIVWRIKQQYSAPPMKGNIAVFFSVTYPDHRRRDISNAWEIYGDCLQEAGVIDDDSQIVFLVLEKEFSPQAKVKIYLWKAGEDDIATLSAIYRQKGLFSMSDGQT